MKIFFFEVTPKDIILLKKEFDSNILEFSTSPLTENYAGITDDIDVISISIDSYITTKVISLFPHLRLIVTRSTGYDHIDLDAARKQDIVVCNAPTYASVTVAEYTFSLILALSRKIVDASNIVKKNLPFQRLQLEGFDLSGKTIGIVGTGNCGKQVARLAHGFGMKIIAYDTHEDKDYASDYTIVYTNFKSVLARSDIITFHVNLHSGTYHMLNRSTLQYVKHGAYIINTARAHIIELAALAQGLKTQQIAGAGIDFTTEECCLNMPTVVADQKHEQELRSYIIHHERVIVTPHNAFNTKESHDRVMQYCIQTIKHWHTGCQINSVS
jgi:D-lactate dehydrogenase